MKFPLYLKTKSKVVKIEQLNNKTDFALVVHACDRYQLLYKGFEYFFEKYWPQGNNLNLYFFTEEIDYQSQIFENIKTGKNEWSDRLRDGLKKINEKYVIYMQEDMWFNKPLDYNTLSQIFKYVTAENPKLLKLHSSGVYQTFYENKFVNGLHVTRLNSETSKFLMSHQISIWDREFLISQLPKNEHPWRHERRGTKRLKKLNYPIYQVDLFAENGNPPINENKTNEYRSEYQTISVNSILNHNAEPFIEELITSADKEISTYGNILRHNFQNGVTHDGLPKPRKSSFQKAISFLGLK